MMRIAIDALRMGDATTSIGTFQRNLLTHLAEIAGEVRMTVFTERDAVVPEAVLSRTDVVRVPQSNSLVELLRISRYVRGHDFDCYFATFNLAPNLPRKLPLVLQNHDFSHGVADALGVTISSRIYRRLHLRSVRRASVLLANSTFTATELRSILGDGARVTAIYHDCDPAFRSWSPTDVQNKVARVGISAGGYLIYVGRVRPPYKNMRVLLEAFRQFHESFRERRLVIISNDDLSSGDARYIERWELPIVWLKNVDVETVKLAYRGARFLVFPSRYEGFGLPILEAQHSGCPVIANRLPPMTEVAGAGALFFDGSSDDLLRKMATLEKDEQLKGSLIERGFANTVRFSWQETARETLRCLMLAASGA